MSTVQAAFDEAALAEVHGIKINIPDGTYNEDPVLAASMGGSVRSGTQRDAIVIEGNQTTPSNVKLNSLFIDGVAAWVNIKGVQLTANNPHDDENTQLAAYNCKYVSVRDLELRDGTNGIMSYNSNVELAGVDFGSNSLTGSAVQTKHNGVAWEQGSISTPTQGTVGTYAYAPSTGVVYCRTNASTLSGDSSLTSANDYGQVIDYSTHTIIGGSPSPAGGGPTTFQHQMITESADNVTVDAGATETVFDTSSSGNTGIFGGIINGFDPSNITVTWFDGSTQTLGAGSGGTDNTGDIGSPVPIPALGPVTKLTFDNGDSGTARDYGWTVYRSKV